MKQTVFLSLLIGLCGAVTSAGAKAAGFAYPSVNTAPGPLDRVDEDLFRVYDREINAVKTALRGSGAATADLKAAVSKELQERNSADFAAFSETPPPQAGTGLPWIAREQAQEVLESMKTHPVVSEEALVRYDPDFKVGFCFGRATYAHVELLRRGVNSRSLAKVFAVGRLYFLGVGWDFHVATVVRGPGRTWWVVDGLRGQILDLEAWKTEMLKMDADPRAPKMRFYFTNPVKLQPIPGAYDTDRLHADLYKGYFRDLESWWQRTPPSLFAGAGR